MKQLERIATALEQVVELLSGIQKAGSISEKRARAGRESAAKRREKYGSAVPFVREQKAVAPNKPEQKASASKTAVSSAPVWNAYQLAMSARHGFVPPPSAQGYSLCKQIIAVAGGLEDATAVVRYYVSTTDAFHTLQKHPLTLLKRDLTRFLGEMKTGRVVTRRDAQRQETYTETDNAVNQYLKKEKENGTDEIPF